MVARYYDCIIVLTNLKLNQTICNAGTRQYQQTQRYSILNLTVQTSLCLTDVLNSLMLLFMDC